MKSLAELENVAVFDQFVGEAVEHTRLVAGIATAEQGFGGNNGVEGRDGQSDANVDAWFENGRWE